MKALTEFKSEDIKILFTDIDDTLTDEGQLKSAAYEALWRLHDNRIKVVPVTGRPAGWCEMIARLWPVAGVIGENGGFYFRYFEKKMRRHFEVDAQTRILNRHKLDQIAKEVLELVPGTAIASDQFSRMLDLAIDFSEDVPPLPDSEVDRIVSIFAKYGAKAKVSSIHVNGWFGDYDKLSACKTFLLNEFNLDFAAIKPQIAFAGDSPNDEPMFQHFQNSFAVANINKFLNRIEFKPKYVAASAGGQGFVEIASALITAKK